MGSLTYIERLTIERKKVIHSRPKSLFSILKVCLGHIYTFQVISRKFCCLLLFLRSVVNKGRVRGGGWKWSTLPPSHLISSLSLSLSSHCFPISQTQYTHSFLPHSPSRVNEWVRGENEWVRGRKTKESTMRDFEKGEIGVNEWGERMFIRVWLGFIWYTR